jgi:hypothetical protein
MRHSVFLRNQARALAITALTVAAVARPAVAQTSAQGRDTAAVAVGDRVRLRSRNDAGRVEGTVSALTRDSLILAGRDSGATRAFAVSELVSLTVRRGLDSWAKTVGYIALAGGVAGATPGLVDCARHRPECGADEQQREAAELYDEPYIGRFDLYALAGLVGGALVGLAVAEPPRWDVIALPMRVGRGGAGGVNGAGWGMRLGLRVAIGAP